MKTHPSSSINGEGHQLRVELFPHAQVVEEMAHVLNPASSLERLLMALPKLDLHFHLNGSISSVILEHMRRLSAASINGVKSEDSIDAHSAAPKDDPLSGLNSATKLSSAALSGQNSSSVLSPSPLMACVGLKDNESSCMSPKVRMLTSFEMFDEVYRIMTNLIFTRLAVQDILWHGAAENVLVLEIRTSLRDKLRWGIFQPDPAEASLEKATNQEGEPSKEDYLWTVINTAEHVLRGGVVDLHTGAFCEAFTQSDLLDYATSLREDTTDGRMARWWSSFEALYGGLRYAPVRPSPRSAAIAACEGGVAAPQTVRLLDHLHGHLCGRMHVRLLVSMNRGAPAAGSWQALELAARIQRAQLCRLHAWLSDAPEGGEAWGPLPDAAAWARALLPPEVARRLRTTCWVTGLDFSGNCYKGAFEDFRPALLAARGLGRGKGGTPVEGALRPILAVTLHGGEKPDPVELAAMVDYHPDRWGHLVFTDPDSLHRILLAGDPIELCITSNILSSGHLDVGQHHFAGLMARARRLHRGSADTVGLGKGATLVQGLLDARSYVAAQHDRLDRRGRRYRSPHRARRSHARDVSLEEGSANEEAGTAVLATIPNISIHTDDRGVFDITLTHELCTILEHPDVLGDRTTAERRVVEAMWRLERLAITHVFELPWPIFLILVAARMDAFPDPKSGSSEAFWCKSGDPLKANSVKCEESVLLRVVSRKLSEVQNWSELKENWSKFEEYIVLQQESENGGAGNPFGELWSGVEWVWLTQCFDDFYTTENIVYS